MRFLNFSPSAGGFRQVLLALLVLSLSACSPRQMIVGNLADELAAQGQAQESDLQLARDAAPFYLKLSESVLRQQPGHLGLAESVSAGFTQYAYAFVAFEADQIESQDARAALSMRQRAAALYRRARDHALAALETLPAAGRLPELRHRRHHRLGRLVERQHRRRVRRLGRHYPGRLRPR